MEMKKSKRLAPSDRVSILTRIEAGERKSNLAREYGISRAAVTKMSQRASGTLPVPVPSPPLLNNANANNIIMESAYRLTPMEEALSSILSHTPRLGLAHMHLYQV